MAGGEISQLLSCAHTAPFKLLALQQRDYTDVDNVNAADFHPLCHLSKMLILNKWLPHAHLLTVVLCYVRL